MPSFLMLISTSKVVLGVFECIASAKNFVHGFNICFSWVIWTLYYIWKFGQKMTKFDQNLNFFIFWPPKSEKQQMLKTPKNASELAICSRTPKKLLGVVAQKKCLSEKSWGGGEPPCFPPPWTWTAVLSQYDVKWLNVFGWIFFNRKMKYNFFPALRAGVILYQVLTSKSVVIQSNLFGGFAAPPQS